MKLIETDLPGCLIIEPKVFGDARGFFYESYNAEKYKSAGLDLRFVQTNVSRSAHGVLRGLHYQWPNPQGKLVSVLEGEVYDVAVDIRHGSPSFGRWAADQIEAAIIMEGPESVAAVFLEPVQNSGGCFPPPPSYFQRVREICDQYDVLLVSDEAV